MTSAYFTALGISRTCLHKRKGNVARGMFDAVKFDQPSQTPRESLRGSQPDPSELARLLGEWMLGDETEQQETFAALRRSLDEDRPEGDKLFS